MGVCRLRGFEKPSVTRLFRSAFLEMERLSYLKKVTPRERRILFDGVRRTWNQDTNDSNLHWLPIFRTDVFNPF